MVDRVNSMRDDGTLPGEPRRPLIMSADLTEFVDYWRARALAAEAALAAERERCAKIAEAPSTIGGPGLEFVLGYAEAQRRIAAAIRAEGE
jgi:hypothetical protein